MEGAARLLVRGTAVQELVQIDELMDAARAPAWPCSACCASALEEPSVYLRIGARERGARAALALASWPRTTAWRARNLGAGQRARAGADGLPDGDRLRAPGGRRAVALRRPRSTTSESATPTRCSASRRDADDGEIKKAFRALARELHPDVNTHDPEAEEKFKEAAEAYEILSDSERRADLRPLRARGARLARLRARACTASARSPTSSTPSSAATRSAAASAARPPARCRAATWRWRSRSRSSEAARGRRGRGRLRRRWTRASAAAATAPSPARRSRPARAAAAAGQLRAVTRTAFGQLVRAQVVRRLRRRRQGRRASRARECGGRGREARARKLSVDVPAGIADEQRIRLSGRGHAGERGGPPGDLYVLVRVAEDERFVRDGNDLVHRGRRARAGRRAGHDGDRAHARRRRGDRGAAPAPSRAPWSRCAGAGMPSLGRGRRGDQRVVVNVVVPRNLSRASASCSRSCAASLTEENLRRAGATSRCSRKREAARSADPARRPGRPPTRPSRCSPRCSSWRPSGVEQVDGDGLGRVRGVRRARRAARAARGRGRGGRGAGAS